MSEKLPDGWFGINGEAWNRSDRASAVVRCYSHDDWQGMVYGPPRMTQEEAEKDRLNLIAGLEGRAGHASEVEAERDAALKELDTLKSRRAVDRAEHLATIHEIGKALNAYLTVEGVTVHYGPHEIAGAVRAQGKALHEARADRHNLRNEIAMLKYERERMADEMTPLEDFRDAANARIADLERQLEEKSALHRSALALVQRLREERSGLRDTIATLEHQIDGLKAAACDAAPQLLRDSMRVTQEESTRIKADMARKDAEIASLRQRAAASEAYAQHLLAALNLRTLQ